MGLVDYSSGSASESADEDPRGHQAKRRRKDTAVAALSSASTVKTSSSVSKSQTVKASSAFVSARTKNGVDGAVSDLPPLPSAFHDLYASSVRQSVVDDPNLHQGRKRQTPHVVGKWPTHVYVEWHPSTQQHAALVQLLDQVKLELGGSIKLHDFLTSDLGATLPLHISLSRPLALSTADKDDFLERITASLRGGGTGPFAVHPCGLAWYRSPDSDRTFLILRVARGKAVAGVTTRNDELMALLTRCNTAAAMFGQPTLYQQTQGEQAGSAFHVSIGWTLGLPSIDGGLSGNGGDQTDTEEEEHEDGVRGGYTGPPDEETCLRALRPFRRKAFAGLRSWRIGVEGVKVKIGNVVSHVPLASAGSGGSKSLFDG